MKAAPSQIASGIVPRWTESPLVNRVESGVKQLGAILEEREHDSDAVVNSVRFIDFDLPSITV